MSAEVVELIGVMLWGSSAKGYRPVVMLWINGTRVHYYASGPCLEDGRWSAQKAAS